MFAFRAMKSGLANDFQQQLVLKWIEYATGTGDWEGLTFRPGGEEGRRETDFAEGKRFVGLQIRKMMSDAAFMVVEAEHNRKEKANKA